MNQLAMNFDAPRAHTRARRTDSDTSHQAAKFAATRKAEQERNDIYSAIQTFGPQTAREVAKRIGLDYVETQRRISEVSGLTKTKEVRDSCRVWSIA